MKENILVDYNREYPAIERALSALRSRLSIINPITNDSFKLSLNNNVNDNNTIISNKNKLTSITFEKDSIKNPVINASIRRSNNEYDIQFNVPIDFININTDNDQNDFHINLTTVPVNKLKYLSIKKATNTSKNAQILKRIYNKTSSIESSNDINNAINNTINNYSINNTNSNADIKYISNENQMYQLYFKRLLSYCIYKRNQYNKYHSIKSNLWSNDIYSKRFHQKLIKNCIQRLGKIKLAILYNKYMLTRFYLSQWIEYCFLNK